MSKPITSIASQIAEALYIRDHAHEIRRTDTELAQQIIGDIASARNDIKAALAAVLRETAQRCAEIAQNKSAFFEACDNLGGMDPTTGVSECAVEVRGGDCLCVAKCEAYSEVASAITKEFGL